MELLRTFTEGVRGTSGSDKGATAATAVNDEGTAVTEAGWLAIIILVRQRRDNAF